MIYGSWDVKCTRHNFFVILGHSLPFYPPNSLKNENFKKKIMKKQPGDIIILPKIMIIGYTVSEIWHMTDVILFFILGYTFPFYPLTDPKMKISMKWKKHLEISSVYTSVTKIMIICYTVPEIWHVTNIIVIFHFGHFLPFNPLPP